MAFLIRSGSGKRLCADRNPDPIGRSGVRNWFRVVIIVTTLACLPWGVPASVSFSEYDVKAAFLFNFARFTQWPEPPDSEMVFCVIGTDPFGGALEQAMRGRQIGNHALRLDYPAVSDASGCHVLFVGRSETRRLDEILEPLRRRPVLTIGEVDRFLGKGGVVNFVVRDNKVRFQINRDAVQEAGLKMSSKLLQMAELVGEQG